MSRYSHRTAAAGIALLTAAALGTLPATGAAAVPDRPASRPDPAAAAVAAAERLISAEPARIHRSPRDSLIRQRVTAGAAGLHYVSYERTYAGLPVVGGDFVVVTDATGKVLSLSVNQRAALAVSTTPTVAAATATAAARSQLRTVAESSRPRLVVLARGTGRLAYETVVTGVRDRLPSRLHVYVDAHSGAVVESRDEVRTGTGTGYYYGRVTIPTAFSGSSYAMADPTRPGLHCGGMDGRVYTGPDDVWGNGFSTNLETACVDALYAAGIGWDMLRSWLGRNGYDGAGRGFPLRVGDDIVNAYWTGYWAAFGHTGTSRQMTAIDVVVHELGHAIFQFTPGGSLGSSGLNESTGDIFGALAEVYLGFTTGPYAVGDEVDIDGEGPIRYMYNPGLLGDPNCWNSVIEYYEPHAGAGVQNHWFYLLAEGSHAGNPGSGRPNSPTCNGARVTGIGAQRAGVVFMETLNRKHSEWTHLDARYYSLQAAREVFANDCSVFRAVRAAWDAVGVPVIVGEPASCP